MTPHSAASSQGAAPAHVGVSEATLWIGALLLVCLALGSVDTTSLAAAVYSVLSHSLVFWLACYAVLRILAEPFDRGKLTTPQGIGLAVVVAAMLFAAPLGIPAALGGVATLYGLVLLTWMDRRWRAAGSVLIALSLHLTWGPLLFRYFLPQILRIDMAGVGIALAAFSPETVVREATIAGANGHTVALVGGCSAFNNISLGLLAYTSMVMLRRGRFARSDLLGVLAVVTLVMTMNTLRLAALGLSAESYAYWHQGDGATIFGVALTAALFALAFAGAGAGAGPGRSAA